MATAEFSKFADILSAGLSQHHLLGFEIAQLEKIEGERRRGRQRMRWLDGITDSMDMSPPTPGVGDRQGSLVCCSPRGHKELNTTELLNGLIVRKNDSVPW